MKYLHSIFTQFRALKTRERVLAVAALLGVLYFVVDFTLVRPQQARAKVLREKITQLDTEVVAQQKLLEALSAPAQTDPLARQRAERDQLRDTFLQAESLLATAAGTTRMSDIVRSMVAARPGITLTSLRTMPVELFFQPPTAAPVVATNKSAASAASAPSPVAINQPPMPTLYKHGIEVTVQGSYPALVSYLQEVEKNSGGLFWTSARLDVVMYPLATLKITVRSLSGRSEMPLG